MSTNTIKRRVRRQAREIRKGTGRLGGTVRSKAGDVGGTVRSKAGDVGGTVRSRAGDLGTAAAARTKDARRQVGYWIAGEKPKRGTGWILAAGAAGAAAAFFLDPANGKRRRHVARDWIAARFRRAGGVAARAGRSAGAQSYGAWRSATHPTEGGLPENDATLTHKVESEVLGYVGIPSGRVNVNAEFGVVTLRGAVDRPEQIDEIERRTRRVNGVRDVQNLLHLSGTSAPTG
jgi:hyperosmotically inducible periplasmic protein